MKIKTKKISDALFYIPFFLVQIGIYAKNVKIISNFSNSLVGLSLIIFMFLSLYRLVQLKTNIKNWIICLTIISISFFSFLFTDDHLLLFLSFTTISSLGMDFKKIVKKDLIFKLLLFLFVYVSYLNGNVLKTYFIRYGEIRNALGFTHPNTFGFYILLFYLEFVYYINSVRVKKCELLTVLFFVVAFMFMNQSHSRTSQICLILFELLYIVHLIRKKINLRKVSLNNNSKKRSLYSLLFILFLIVSFYITYKYSIGNSVAIKIDDLLSGRLELQNIFIKLYDITFFGNKVDYFDTLDNSYIRTILNFGIIGCFAYMKIFNSIFSVANINKDDYMRLIVLVIMVYGLMEWYMIRPVINVFLLYFSTNIIRKKDEYEK